MDRNPRILIRVGSALCRNGIGFVRGVTCINVAILENNCGVTKYKVHCPINVTIFVELSIGVDIKGILIPFKATTIEYG